jgi:hypothetical protein
MYTVKDILRIQVARVGCFPAVGVELVEHAASTERTCPLIYHAPWRTL